MTVGMIMAGGMSAEPAMLALWAVAAVGLLVWPGAETGMIPNEQ